MCNMAAEKYENNKERHTPHLEINHYVQKMGGLGLNGIKLPMAIEKIKILVVILELLVRQQNQVLNRSLSHIMNLQLETYWKL